MFDDLLCVVGVLKLMFFEIECDKVNLMIVVVWWLMNVFGIMFDELFL